MSFRHSNAGITGSNNIPLGNRRRFGQEDEGEQRSPSGGSVGFKRGRSRERSDVLAAADAGPRPRKKKNRWGAEGENKAAGLIGIPTAIIAPMTAEQLDAYVMNMRIEEISAKIRINDVVPKDGERSPSPPPQYDNQGKRVNTREYRYKKRLEDERHKLVEKALKTIPNYKPPSEYRRPTKTQEKVYVPVNDYPELNFIGLLIGPRGNTLKKMESESGAKIAIRGKGSVKEGKGKSDAAHASNQEEDLHCLIMADTEAKINKAKELIHNVIETAASIPEGQNELKRNQLRELAALNGTLRDDENQACQNCGEIGHRKYDCPNKANYTANIVCRVCGNSGHMARDCPDRPAGGYRGNDRGGFGGRGRIGAPATQDDEYERLMASITDGGAIGTAGGAQRIEGGAGFGNDAYGAGAGDAQKPWERNAPMAAAPWRQSNPQDDQRNSGPAPWRNNQDNFGNGRGAAPWNSGRGSGGGGGGGGGGYGSGRGGRGGYNEHDSGNARPWAQGGDRYNANHAYNNNNNSYNANGYNYGYGNGGGGNGYDNTGSGGAAPWAQQGGSAPWATSYNAPGQDAPPPPPPGDFAPPPPPPSGSVPPPPPPSEKPPPPPPPGL